MAWPLAAGAFLGGAGLNFIGQTSANRQNARAQDRANEANYGMQGRQHQFEANMSDTAYRRARKDLEAAGFNPLIALGGPASTPSGAGGTASAAKIDNPLGGVATSAMEGLNLFQQAKKQGAEIGQIESNIAVNQTQKQLNQANAHKAVVDAQVAAKNIPESEIKNSLHKNFTKPFMNKLTEMVDTSAKIDRTRNLELPAKFLENVRKAQKIPIKGPR